MRTLDRYMCVIEVHRATMQHDHHLDAERVCRVSLVPGLAVSSAVSEALTRGA